MPRTNEKSRQGARKGREGTDQKTNSCGQYGDHGPSWQEKRRRLMLDRLRLLDWINSFKRAV